MPIEDNYNQIECPYCGKLADVSLTSCPECGQSFYPEDEPNRERRIQPARKEGLVLRIISFILIGALLGGGFGLVVGPNWVWMVLAGAVFFGLLGWVGDWIR